jgi:hypothetical protein
MRWYCLAADQSYPVAHVEAVRYGHGVPQELRPGAHLVQFVGRTRESISKIRRTSGRNRNAHDPRANRRGAKACARMEAEAGALTNRQGPIIARREIRSGARWRDCERAPRMHGRHPVLEKDRVCPINKVGCRRGESGDSPIRAGRFEHLVTHRRQRRRRCILHGDRERLRCGVTGRVGRST